MSFSAHAGVSKIAVGAQLFENLPSTAVFRAFGRYLSQQTADVKIGPVTLARYQANMASDVIPGFSLFLVFEGHTDEVAYAREKMAGQVFVFEDRGQRVEIPVAVVDVASYQDEISLTALPSLNRQLHYGIFVTKELNSAAQIRIERPAAEAFMRYLRSHPIPRLRCSQEMLRAARDFSFGLGEPEKKTFLAARASFFQNSAWAVTPSGERLWLAEVLGSLRQFAVFCRH